jgi:hypothetical protein
MFGNREMARAWTWEHTGKVIPEVTPLRSIETVSTRTMAGPKLLDAPRKAVQRRGEIVT